ncbi:MAG: response regulator [Elusimicrobiota bacterium]
MANIVIADDDEEILEYLRTGLESTGHSVYSTLRGKEALQLIKDRTPDIIILDVMMPDVDGYSLVIELSDDADTKNIPVLITTALSPTKTLFDRYPQVVGFFMKPLDINILNKTINTVLAKKNNSKNKKG